MKRLLNQYSLPAILFYAFLFITQTLHGFLSAGYHESSMLYQIIERIGFVWLLCWWLQHDSRKYQIKWVLDMGLWLWLAWPFILPYYLIKTRGKSAWTPLAVFLGVYVVATLFGVLIYFTLFGIMS